MEKFLNWLKQTSTIGGILSLAVTGIQAVQSGGDGMTVTLAVLSAALLLVNDGKFLAGLCVILFVGGAQAGCGASFPDLPISDEDKIDIAITAGCSAAASAGCLEDDDVVDLFGDLKTAPQCAAAVKTTIETKHLSIDLSKLTARNMTCKKFVSAFIS